MRETRKRGFSIKPEGLALIEKKMAEKGYNSREKLAEAAELSIYTINRVFWGHKPQRDTIEAIAPPQANTRKERSRYTQTMRSPLPSFSWISMCDRNTTVADRQSKN